MKLSNVLGVGVLFALTACGSPAADLDSTEDTASAAIVNGTPDTQDRYNDVCTMELTFFAPWGPKFPVCTIVLLSPTVGLTAAHCVVPRPSDPPIYSAALVCDPRGAAPGAKRYQIQSATPHPQFSRKTFDPVTGIWPYDVGVIHLAEPVEGVERFAQLPSEGFLGDLFSGKGADHIPLTMVGYGLPAGPVPHAPSNIRRVGSAVFGDLYSRFLITAANPSANCSNDSGSPTFLASSQKLLTVGANAGDCQTYSAGTRLDIPETADFINSELGD